MKAKIKRTPKQHQFILPAEWETHRGTWLTYPQNPESFFDQIEEARSVFLQMIKILARGEEVFINVDDEEVCRDLERRLREEGVNNHIIIIDFKTDDSWCRDNGSIFIKNNETKEIAAVNCRFNAWGGKYPYENDAKLPEKMSEYLKVKSFPLDMVLEGGSIESNGRGVILATRDCLFNSNRNPDLTHHQIEENLQNYFGAEKVLWLEEGIQGGDTDSHIDEIARFVDANTIVAAFEENLDDENSRVLLQNFTRLKTFKNLKNKPFKVIPLPMPRPQFYK